MSTYRYFTTDLITGTLRADTIPLHVQSFSRNLGGVGQPGTLSGFLDLGVLTSSLQANYLSALEPRKTVLWVMQDNLPIWAGIIWGWPHTSAVSNQLPIAAKEISSLLAKREIRSNQNFTEDRFAIVRDLISYAIGKTNGTIANLILGTAMSGTTATAIFNASNLTKVLDAINSFCAQQNIEWALTPGWDSTATIPQITLQLGAPTLGRPVTDTNLLLQYPSVYITDYAFPRDGDASVNSLLATASASGQIPWQSGAAHGQNSADFAAGYPLLEDSLSWTTSAITTQAQIDAVADGKLPALSGCTTIPSVTIGGGGIPTAGQIQLGDHARLVATSPLHPADPDTGAPGLQATVRIIGWTIQPTTDQQSESTQLILGGITT